MITVITETKPIIIDCRYNSSLGDVTNMELFDRHGKHVPKELLIRGNMTFYANRTLCIHLDQVSQPTDPQEKKIPGNQDDN